MGRGKGEGGKDDERTLMKGQVIREGKWEWKNIRGRRKNRAEKESRRREK